MTTIGDDTDPPEQGAVFMTERYFAKFPGGAGVLQPCGDSQGELMTVKGYEHLGLLHNAARICGSPVFGRGWAESAYQSGPFHDGYRSYWADEDCWNRAMRLVVLWLDAKTMHYHWHWSFKGGLPYQPYHKRAQENWAHDAAVFRQRQAQGFPA